MASSGVRSTPVAASSSGVGTPRRRRKQQPRVPSSSAPLHLRLVSGEETKQRQWEIQRERAWAVSSGRSASVESRGRASDTSEPSRHFRDSSTERRQRYDRERDYRRGLQGKKARQTRMQLARWAVYCSAQDEEEERLQKEAILNQAAERAKQHRFTADQKIAEHRGRQQGDAAPSPSPSPSPSSPSPSSPQHPAEPRRRMPASRPKKKAKPRYWCASSSAGTRRAPPCSAPSPARSSAPTRSPPRPLLSYAMPSQAQLQPFRKRPFLRHNGRGGKKGEEEQGGTKEGEEATARQLLSPFPEEPMTPLQQKSRKEYEEEEEKRRRDRSRGLETV